MGEKYENVTRSRKQIFANNFIGGLAWGIGGALGLALLFVILGFLVHYVNLVPIVGNFVLQVIDFVIAKQPGITSSTMPFIWAQYAYA